MIVSSSSNQIIEKCPKAVGGVSFVLEVCCGGAVQLVGTSVQRISSGVLSCIRGLVRGLHVPDLWGKFD